MKGMFLIGDFVQFVLCVFCKSFKYFSYAWKINIELLVKSDKINIKYKKNII